MQSLSNSTRQLDRKIKTILRQLDEDSLDRREKQDLAALKLAINEVRLDIRDYEYAQTRDDQLKWAALGRHNLAVLNKLMIRLDSVFSPVDVADFGATVDQLKTSLE